jgi:ribosome-interacting GTPase 1
MPTNVTPEYKKAEEAYRKAREPKERLDCLRELLRTIPKHKGTEHLQADIKTRIKQLSEELAGPKKGGRRKGPSHVVRPEGAAQLCLIGPPNAGKSSLHARLTGSRTDIGPYPFTTHLPVPGMLPYEDIHFQLVDLPPVSADFMEPWLINTLQHADGVLLVIDLTGMPRANSGNSRAPGGKESFPQPNVAGVGFREPGNGRCGRSVSSRLACCIGRE